MDKFIYIYDDIGTSDVGVASLLISAKTHLKLKVNTINAQKLIESGLSDAIALVIPGGADLPYCTKLNGRGNQIIRDFVENGGLYIGICAGAYYACEHIDFVGQEYQVHGERELRFFPGIAKGSLPDLTSGYLFDETVNSKTMISLKFEDLTESPPLYYHGGPTFIANADDQNYQIIARYPNQQPAIITGKFGNGDYFLSGIHFELQKDIYEEIVVKYAKYDTKNREYNISKQIDDNYGKEIWQILSSILKKRS